MGLFYRTRKGENIDFTVELKGDWYSDIRQETRARYLAPEWYPQSGVEIIWPDENTDWRDNLAEVTDTYVRLAFEIASRELLLIVTPEVDYVKSLIGKRLPQKALRNIVVAPCQINDTWSRDSGFLSVVSSQGVELMDFKFNGWGNKFKSDKDDSINKHLFDNHFIKGQYIDCGDFVLEGGSIDVDELGTMLTTESCLLSPSRNPNLNKLEIEQKLIRYFGISRVLWLSHGHLTGDDTDGHIDTLARLCSHGRIAYVKCYDANDEQHDELSKMEQELQSFCQPSGENYELVPLPLPRAVYATSQDGKTQERLPATYANYLVINKAVLMPTYNQPDNDEKAARTLQQLYPRHEIVKVPCLSLIRQHGSLHCSTMQFPGSVITKK